MRGRGGSPVFECRAMAISCWIMTVVSVFADPSWWTTRRVLATNTIPNDFAPVLAGQVKWLATNALCEFEEKLPGGAGTEVRGLVAGGGDDDHYGAVNVGQLKSVAAAFYRRLIEEGVTADYPWGAGEASDFSPVNIGQAKHAFGFDLAGAVFGPSITGLINYPGCQTGRIYVVASPANGMVVDSAMGIAATGVYHMAAGLAAGDWSVEAWRDSDGDTQRDSWEAVGDYAFNPFTITSAVAGVNLMLADPDEDQDGIPGYLEIQLGLDPDYPFDAWVDADGDGLSLADELRYGSDTFLGDTDNDGMGDGAEVVNGFSPTNSPAHMGLPFAEPFEPPEVMAGDVAGQNGWYGSTNHGAVVITNPAISGQQSLCLHALTNGGSALTHPLATHGIERLWIDGHVVPVWRTDPSPVVPATTVASAFYFNLAGQVVVYDKTWPPGEWGVVTNGPAIAAGATVRFTIQQDYARHRWGLWLNGTNVVRNLPFTGTATELARLRFAPARYSDMSMDDISVTSGAPSGFVADSDVDGMPDDWELAHGLDPYHPSDSSGLSDPDHDGLTNLEEYRLGLDPNDPDSDHDGWNDGVEQALGIAVTHVDDGVAATIPFLDPFELPAVAPGNLAGQHGWEGSATNGTIVQSSNHVGGTQAAELMPTTNTLTHTIKGAFRGVTWSDWWSIPVRRGMVGFPPLRAVTTAAFYVDDAGRVVVADGGRWATMTNAPEISVTNWCRFTVMQDFSNQIWSLFLDGSLIGVNLGFAHRITQYTGMRITGARAAATFLDDIRVTGNAPGDIDSDGDGLPNDWELAHGLDPSDPSDPSDPDQDGLINLQEYRLGLDPAKRDTDGDGMGDGVEIARGFSPTNTNLFMPVPFTENYEPPSVIAGDLNGQHEWVVTSSNIAAVVQTNVFSGGRQALQLGGVTSSVSLYHPLAATGIPVVWTDVRSMPVFRGIVVPPILDDASAVGFFVDAAGRVVVADSGSWVTLTNHPPLSSGIWTRFTCCQDFASQMWSLYLDGVPVATNLAFVHPVSEYSGFAVKGSVNDAGVLDAILVSTNPPGDIDSDGDGLPDDWELSHGLDPSGPSDPDHDGLSNLEEYRRGTNPRLRDTDGDGLGDGAECALGFNPGVSNVFSQLPFAEGFEGPAVEPGNLNGQHGWTADGTNTMFVQTNVVWEETQALSLSSTGTVGHVVSSAGAQVVWVDLRTQPVRRLLEANPAVHSNEASAFYINSTGLMTACSCIENTQRWETLSGHSPVVTGRWVRLTVCQDYAVGTWSLWLDGVRIAHDLAFASPAAEFSGLRVSGPMFSTSYLDGLSVTTNEPPGLDTDGDGLPDTWERARGLDSENPADALSDPDLDGLNNLEEYRQGTDPRDPDSDHDGLVDGHDGVMPVGLFPGGVDRNGDGFADGELDYGCDPLSDDSDSDGVKDGDEVALGLDPSHSTLGQGLVAWYKLDETNGTLIADSSGNRCEGEWMGGDVLAGTVGRMGGALQFDGIADGVKVFPSGVLGSLTNYSLSVWVRQETGATDDVQVLVAQEGNCGLVLNRRRPECHFAGSTPTVLADSESLPSGDWAQVTVTLGGGHAALYVDGAVVAATNLTGGGSITEVPWGLGVNAMLTNDHFKGGLDDVRFYSRALSSNEVQELYIMGADPDNDTAGSGDELASGGDPVTGQWPSLVSGDLDGDGHLTIRDRDRLAALSRDMKSDVTRYNYDEEGNVVRKVDALGQFTVMSYNRNGRLLTTTDGNGHTTANELDASGAVVARTDAVGQVTKFAFDAFGEVTNLTDASGNDTRMEYNVLGQVVRTVNSRGVGQTTEYDDLGRVRCVTVPTGMSDAQRLWSYYDAGDNLVSNRNNIGVVNEYRHDARGQLVQQILARRTSVEAVEETVRDFRGLATGHRDRLGHWSYTSHDALSRPAAVTDPLGNITRTEYDNLGRVIAVVQPTGRILRTEYDKWGRVVRVRDGADLCTTDYDAVDRVISRTDWRGIRSEYAYDAAGNVTNTVNAAGTPDQAGTVTFCDGINRPVRIVNANGQSVLHSYDAAGNLAALVDELGHVSRWFYRHGNRLDGYCRPDGSMVTNLYDALDRLVEVRVDGVARQAFAYDGLSRMTNAVDFNQVGLADDSSVVYEYDELNRVVHERQNGKSIQRQYDAADHVVQMQYPSGFVLAQTFDGNDRLQTLKNSGGTMTFAAYTYTPNSRIETITFGSGVVETHGLDSRERLRTLVQQGAYCNFGAVLARDPDGNVTLCSETDAEGSSFLYDHLNRVTARKNLADLFQESLRYDAMGNWLCHSNEVRGAVTRSVNAGNQYSQIAAQALQYDPNGDLTGWGGREFVYDFLSRLTEVRSNGVSLARYSYDARNRRVSKEVGENHIAYYYDGNNLIDESVGGNWFRSTVYGDTVDSPVATMAGGQTFYYLRDWRANIAAITDTSGHLVERYRYSLFGEMSIQSGEGNPVAQSSVGNIWTFAGRQWDPETGFMHNQNRAYSAELGRFLQRDPAGYGDGMNLYAYAGNNPLLFSDPYGLYRWSHGALDERVGDWIFQQYGQLREIERQRREYEEALRRAEEERQRIQRANEYAARAFNQFKAQHANEVKDMAGRYRHLGVNDDEAARLLMSGISEIPRLGATVGPNDTRRSWWLDYYLRGGQMNKTMKDEMAIMGTRNVDEYFAKTNQKETALRNKRKATQQQYTMAAVAIVATVVTAGAGGALGAAMLGTVGVTASTMSFGAFVAGAVAIQGAAAAATTMISHGNIGDFAQSWAINSAASVAGYGAGFEVAKAGGDMTLQLASQSAVTTFVSSGSRSASEGGGFKNVFRDTAISFAAGGVMGTFMNAPAEGIAPDSFGGYVQQGSSSSFGYLHSPVSGGVQGSLHAAVYGGNIVEAFGEGAVSREALSQYLMASAVAPVAGWMTSELVAALPGTSLPAAQPVEWRESPASASERGGPGAVTMEDSPLPSSSVGRFATGVAMTVASHVREVVVAPARAVSSMYETMTADTWKERSRLINPFSRNFAGYQLLDKATDAALVAGGLPISLLSGDFMDVQRSADMRFDENGTLVTFNGIANSSLDASRMRDIVQQQYSVHRSTHVVNRTAWRGIGDAVQILGNEVGLIDIAAIRGAEALRSAGGMSGPINVVAHSQGSMTFRRALDLVDEPATRSRIDYRGAGPEIYNSSRYLGLHSARNLWNEEDGAPLHRDPVPLANYLPLPARVLGDPFMMPGYVNWQRVDSPGNRSVPNGNRHGYESYYEGYTY